MRALDEQRYLWLFRAFVILLVISIFTNIVLLSAFNQISPTPKKEAFFISTLNDKIEKVYITRKPSTYFNIEQDNLGYEIAKNYINEYITARESLYNDQNFIKQLIGERGIIYNFSTSDIYDNFISAPLYKLIISKNKSVLKNINIKSLDYQPNAKHWIANIEINTTNKKGITSSVSEQRLKIVADFKYYNEKRTSLNKWINPLNFRITKYEYIN